jgi:hypothetical protein
MIGRVVFEPIERALAGQSLAVGAPLRFQFSRQHRQCRVLAQFVVIVEVLVAQRQAENPLSDQRLHLMLYKLRIAPIRKASGNPAHQVQPAVHQPHQQRPGVRGHRPAVKRRHHRPPIHR